MNTTTSEAPLIKPRTAREEFLEWYRIQKEQHGLVDIKFFPGDTSQAPAERFYAAANALNRAVAEGRYKIVTDL